LLAFPLTIIEKLMVFFRKILHKVGKNVVCETGTKTEISKLWNANPKRARDTSQKISTQEHVLFLSFLYENIIRNQIHIPTVDAMRVLYVFH
jgi:hypothetical protein